MHIQVKALLIISTAEKLIGRAVCTSLLWLLASTNVSALPVEPLPAHGFAYPKYIDNTKAIFDLPQLLSETTLPSAQPAWLYGLWPTTTLTSRNLINLSKPSRPYTTQKVLSAEPFRPYLVEIVKKISIKPANIIPPAIHAKSTVPEPSTLLLLIIGLLGLWHSRQKSK